MTASAKSLFYMGIYGVCLGLLLIIIPGSLISFMQLPPLQEGWARIISLLALVIGTYDIFCGKNNIVPMIHLSMYVRLGFAIAVVLLVAFNQMPVMILLAGALDALGALWTWLALKSEATKKL
jgi:hypothetical protein